MTIRFGKTESWTSGWQGKANSTDIFCGKRKIGTISGQEGALREMTYSVECEGIPSFQSYSLKDAKEQAVIARAAIAKAEGVS